MGLTPPSASSLTATLSLSTEWCGSTPALWRREASSPRTPRRDWRSFRCRPSTSSHSRRASKACAQRSSGVFGPGPSLGPAPCFVSPSSSRTMPAARSRPPWCAARSRARRCWSWPEQAMPCLPKSRTSNISMSSTSPRGIGLCGAVPATLPRPFTQRLLEPTELNVHSSNAEAGTEPPRPTLTRPASAANRALTDARISAIEFVKRPRYCRTALPPSSLSRSDSPAYAHLPGVGPASDALLGPEIFDTITLKTNARESHVSDWASLNWHAILFLSMSILLRPEVLRHCFPTRLVDVDVTRFIPRGQVSVDSCPTHLAEIDNQPAPRLQ